MKRFVASMAVMVTAGILAGCEGRAALIPNKDPSLRKTSAQFAADAAKRSYPADAPLAGEAAARAEVDYTLKAIHIANLSPDDWENVEVWVNKKYSVFLPKLPHDVKGSGYRHINFQMLYDSNGQHIPVSAFGISKIRIEQVQLFHDGKLWDVPVKLAD